MDINFGEWVVLAVLALVIFGPEKLPKVAADAAKLLRDLRGMLAKARAEVTNELGPEFADIDLADLNPRSFVSKHLLEDLDDVREAALGDGGRRAAKGTVAGDAAKEPTELAAGERPPWDDDAT